MKSVALAAGVLGLTGLAFGEKTTTIYGTRTRRGEQPAPTMTLSAVPYTTVTDCWSTTGTSACRTETQVCPFGSTTTLQTWMSKDCNWSDMIRTPKPSLTCSTTSSTYMACLTTGSDRPLPMPSRSQRLVANHAQAVPTTTEGSVVSTSSTLPPPVPTRTSSNMGGGRSQRGFTHHTTTDSGGRSQRWVADEAQALPTTNLGRRHNRYVKRVVEAEPTPAAEMLEKDMVA
ncbi:uncharacterized protein K460DRAFT_429361 [Cucurbitaria berberidis CBS 394.84]|uniref:Uncharacterized protein n=1 Tax=Cucurbitaria berberidis CBS 394.84 TaxID=1168544 RepID=A0A9P4GFR4_9PLEO|nr:uncharacterized protein K460DRAFT_429361 [Cucurbitaria berberidis CBS 394.84]KAF1844619.1 hypothetical protein K460DRAFT_429361 [Cucurbitaria berberidis CBS 394.84]